MMKLIVYMHNFGGGRSDLFNSGGGEVVKRGGGRDILKIQGELAKRGVKKFRGGGVWTLDEAMS